MLFPRPSPQQQKLQKRRVPKQPKPKQLPQPKKPRPNLPRTHIQEHRVIHQQTKPRYKPICLRGCGLPRYYTQYMSTDMTRQISSASSAETEELAQSLGRRLKGGEVIELVSDLGGGKTTFVRGLAKGAGSPDKVASPS